MATPTLSMQIHGEFGWRAAQKRERREAAKKAWRTRRRMAKVSPKMLAVMRAIFQERRYLSICYMGKTAYHVGVTGVNPDGSQFYPGTNIRVTKATFRAMEKRGWLEYHRRRVTGGWSDGTRKRVSYDLDYRLSDKGRDAFHKAENARC